MSEFWSLSVKALKPYVPGEQPQVDDLIKLNTNEHPLPPSPKVLEAIQAGLNDSLRLYPDPEGRVLREAIARRHGVQPENVFVGNGSDEVLAHVFFALLKQSRPLFFPDITYGFYPTYCTYFDVDYELIPLDDKLRVRVADYTGDAGAQAGAILFANPNAPTGHALTRDEIREILEANPDKPVVIDEAYVDFGGETAVPLIKDHPNLLTVHTLSKAHSLAGMRVGYAIGSPELVEGLERAKNSFNSYPLDRLALLGATAAIEDEAYFEAACRTVIDTREKLADDLRKLGFEVLPSSTNFLFVRHPDVGGGELSAWLRSRNILVRHFDHERIRDYIRITVGTPQQCDSLIEALQTRLQG